MRYLDLISVCVFAISAAIVVAAFAGRMRYGTLRTTLLILASVPCLIFAGLTVFAVNHNAPTAGRVIGGVISLVGLVLVAVAGRFGSNLWAGWGLLLLAGLASAPLVLLAAAVFFYANGQTGLPDPPSRGLSYSEQLERSRQMAAANGQKRADAKRETTRLRICANELSIATGKAAARRNHRAGRIQFVIVARPGQDSGSEWFPGLSQADLNHYNLKNRSSSWGALIPSTTSEGSGAHLIRPPYELWSDPWGGLFGYVLPSDIQRCDEAVLAYASAYNQTMRKLDGAR